MDVDGLRNELEEHLKKNPDEHAPQGFRDRFEAAVAKMSVEDDGIAVEVQETELQRIRDEAQAAAKAAGESGAGEASIPPKRKTTIPAKPPRGGDPAPIEDKIDDHGTAASATERDGGAGGIDAAGPPAMLQRFGLPAGIAVVVLIVAYFVLRG